MKSFFAKILNGIKQDVKPANIDFKYTLIWCCAFAISALLSLFWGFFVALMLISCAGAIITAKGGRAAYILIFIVPITTIFKFNNDQDTLRAYVHVFATLVLLIKYAFGLFRKKEKLELVPTIICAVLLIFLCTTLLRPPFTFEKIVGVANLGTGIVFLYLLWNFRRDIDLREVFILFFCGIVLSVGLGTVIRCVDTRIVDAFINLEVRFGGIWSDVGMFALEAILCLAVLTVLFLNNEMRYLFYPMFGFLMACAVASGSKVSYFILAFIVLYLTSAMFVKFIKSDKQRKKQIITSIIAIVIICAAVLAIFNFVVVSTLDRYVNIGSETNDPASEISVLDRISTFRFGIWIQYLEAIFSDFWRALFGFGAGAEPIGSHLNGGIVFGQQSTHNTFLSALFYIGIFGVVIIVLWALVLLIPLIKQKKVNWMNCVAVIAFGMFIMAVHIFTNILAIYLLILLPVITYRGRKYQKQISANSNY